MRLDAQRRRLLAQERPPPSHAPPGRLQRNGSAAHCLIPARLRQAAPPGLEPCGCAREVGLPPAHVEVITAQACSTLCRCANQLHMLVSWQVGPEGMQLCGSAFQAGKYCYQSTERLLQESQASSGLLPSLRKTGERPLPGLLQSLLGLNAA